MIVVAKEKMLIRHLGILEPNRFGYKDLEKEFRTHCISILSWNGAIIYTVSSYKIVPSYKNSDFVDTVF